MSQIILQPASNVEAQKHFVDTITNPVSLVRIKSNVSSETFNKLQKLFPEGKVAVWGVTPGAKDGNKKKWDRVMSGDVALFSRNKVIFASATVAFTMHSKDLAIDLWGEDGDRNTWEYVYFLDEVTSQEITYEKFNEKVGYKKNNNIQGFNVLDQEKSLRALELLGLQSETYYPDATQDDYLKAISEPKEGIPLDKEGISRSRIEQGYLRKVLFKGNKSAICGICGKEYPINFLIAAHIKKRADCSDIEKRDFENIAMPMCKFGCDDLYEKGYIYIDQGKTAVNEIKYRTPPVEDYINKIINLNCPYWSEKTREYFSFHAALHRQLPR